MSESAPEGQTEQHADGGSNNSGWTPPASQVEFNRIITERVNRERAKYADYDDLKGKAAQIDQATERAAQADAALAEVPGKVAAELRTHLIALHDIDAEDAALFLTASDPETLLKQVQRWTVRSTQHGNVVPREGTPTTAPHDSERETVRSLFKDQ